MEKTYKEKKPETLPIVVEPNMVLRKKAADVAIRDITTPKIQKLLDEMKAALAATPDGVGLAAPQVGESLRIFIVSEEAEEVDRAEKEGWERQSKENPAVKNERPYKKRPWRYYVFVNPVLKNSSRRKLMGPEGCLSVPGKFGQVARHERVSMEALDAHGKKFRRNASRFFARVMQHEFDHLKGILFIDTAEDLMHIPERKKEDDEK